MRGPSAPPAPVNGVRMPNFRTSWPLARLGNAAATVIAAAPWTSLRRVVLVMGGPRAEKARQKYSGLAGGASGWRPQARRQRRALCVLSRNPGIIHGAEPGH